MMSAKLKYLVALALPVAGLALAGDPLPALWRGAAAHSSTTPPTSRRAARLNPIEALRSE
jgi:hypothetical protein